MTKSLGKNAAKLFASGAAEHDLQCVVMDFLDLALPRHEAIAFAVPNGGKRDKGTALKLKREGQRNGVADIMVIWNGRPIGIEMKTAKGVQTDDQKQWAKDFTLAGGVYAVCRSVDEVAAMLDATGIPLRARI
ncbi:MAG: VRR-NUC domain-containing protein [Pseudomonadota bacterium]